MTYDLLLPGALYIFLRIMRSRPHANNFSRHTKTVFDGHDRSDRFLYSYKTLMDTPGQNIFKQQHSVHHQLSDQLRS